MTLLGVPRQLAVSLLPVVLAAPVLAGWLLLGGAGPGAGFPASGAAAAALVLSFVLAAALGSLHRPLGGPALALGAAALPGAILVLGTPAAGAVAAAGALLGALGRRLLRDLSPAGADERRGLPRLAEGAARAALATLAAGGAWALVAGAGSSRPAAGSFGLAAGSSGPAAGSFWLAAGAAGGAYLAAWAALLLGAEVLRRPRRGPRGPRPWRLGARLALPLAVDAAGWAVGSALARVGEAAGWGLAAALLWAVALLAAEAARLGFLQGAFERRAVDLARVGRATHRMAVSGFGLSGLAAQLRSECVRLLDLHWFQITVYPDGGPDVGPDLGPPAPAEESVRSWWAGPDGVLRGGTPDPGPAPPALPGIHRRRPWRTIERELAVGDRRLARLTLWCDPRKVRPADVERLDALLPQLATWVHRALLDREAREDPLTGVPTRRHLERVLAEAFARAWEGEGRLAVVLADLDHFKRINDTRGHAAGDRALVAVARTLEAHRRAADTCARYGGEEFALVVAGGDGAAALQVAERLRRAVECLEVEAEGVPVVLTVSAGVAAFPELFASAPGELLALADEALYEAKRRGRNRALLNLGRGRYREPGSAETGADDDDERPVVAPRIFV